MGGWVVVAASVVAVDWWKIRRGRDTLSQVARRHRWAAWALTLLWAAHLKDVKLADLTSPARGSRVGESRERREQ